MASKTVYPGMPMSNNAGGPFNPAGQMTQFPGMGPNTNTENNQGKPIMGFMYSVSKTPYGEYWPLYVGPNTIGRGSNCSICLKEASISENHATLVIRKLQNNGEKNGVVVFIQDTGSMYGTMLNGSTLDFNPRECKNGDIITIGANYELYFMLVDADELGLHTKEEFKASESKPASPAGPDWGTQFRGAGAAAGTLPGNGSSPFEGRKPTIYMPKK